MADFVLSTLTGDLDFGENNSTGLQLHDNFPDEATQRLRQALAINLAEWFVNINDGLPYIKNNEEGLGEDLRYFLGDKTPNLVQFITSSLDIYISGLPFVKNFLKSESEFDRDSRKLTYTFDAELTDGAVITFPFDTFI